jgi:predicted transcriptional regulator
MVHAAIQSLPDSMRIVTALYYIGGMAQREIGKYLGISEPAVKKRLFNARRKLKEYIVNMAKSMSDERMPAELVSRPQSPLIKDHPIRKMVDRIEAALPEYEVIESHEVEEMDIYPSIRDSYFSGYGDGYHLDAASMLRSQTSGATLRAIEGRDRRCV